MRAHQFEHERIKPAHDRARGRFVVLARGGDERGRIQTINHVIQDVSTLMGMTAGRASGLQNSGRNQTSAWHFEITVTGG
jgi:hypothetical protein